MCILSVFFHELSSQIFQLDLDKGQALISFFSIILDSDLKYGYSVHVGKSFVYWYTGKDDIQAKRYMASFTCKSTIHEEVVNTWHYNRIL